MCVSYLHLAIRIAISETHFMFTFSGNKTRAAAS